MLPSYLEKHFFTIPNDPLPKIVPNLQSNSF